jgi:hypothetical protein
MIIWRFRDESGPAPPTGGWESVAVFALVVALLAVTILTTGSVGAVPILVAAVAGILVLLGLNRGGGRT